MPPAATRLAAPEIDSKGQQFTARRLLAWQGSVWERLSLDAGDRIEFTESALGLLDHSGSRDIRSLKGIVPKPKEPVTIEDNINRAIMKMGRMR